MIALRRTSLRALLLKPTQYTCGPLSTPIRSTWGCLPRPGNVVEPQHRSFSSTPLKASLENQREEEISQLAKELEKKNKEFDERREWKSDLWWLLILVPISIYAYFHNKRINAGIWSPKLLTPFTVIKRENVSSTAFILTIRPQFGQHRHGKDVDPYAEFWDQGTWSVSIVQPELRIARHYTPLPPLPPDKPEELRFLIRRIEDGEVSVYLDHLAVGAMVTLFHPVKTIGLEAVEDKTDILFLAGGTGIAPALGLAYSLLERKHAGTRPKIHIMWASRRREDCLGGANHGGGILREGVQKNRIVKELDDLQAKYPDQLFVEYFVDEERTSIDEKKILDVVKSRSVKTSTPSKLLLVSGPEGFVDYFAGPKVWEYGQHKQGPVGGLLGRLNLEDWAVTKV